MPRLQCACLPLALCLVTGCGLRPGTPKPATGGDPGTASGSAAQLPATQAPSRLVYSTDPAVYTKGVAIAPNTPYGSGGLIGAYRINPHLPAGLTLDSASGIISGTPTAAVPATNYEITGSNPAGSTSVTLNLAVLDQAPGGRPVVSLPSFVTAAVGGLTASTADLGPGTNYAWTLQGGSITAGQGSSTITFSAGEAGPLTASVTVSNSGGSTSGRAEGLVVRAPDASMRAPATLLVGDSSRQATVTAQPGMTYTWTIVPGGTGASIASGQGTSTVGLAAGPTPGSFQLQVRVQNQAGAAATAGGTIKVQN